MEVKYLCLYALQALQRKPRIYLDVLSKRLLIFIGSIYHML